MRKLRASTLLWPVNNEEYLNAGIITLKNGNICIKVDPIWTTAGEDRLGYTQIIRLLEVVRLHHLQKALFVESLPSIDFTIKSLNVNFYSPIHAFHSYEFSTCVTSVGNAFYVLNIDCKEVNGKKDILQSQMKSVFIDLINKRPRKMPFDLHNRLITALGDKVKSNEQ